MQSTVVTPSGVDAKYFSRDTHLFTFPHNFTENPNGGKMSQWARSFGSTLKRCHES
jgi:hypothetical protein